MDNDTTLCEPSMEYKDSYLAAITDYKQNHEYHITAVEEYFDATTDNFPKILQKMHDWSNGINLPADFVPSSQFWMIKDNKYIGTVDIRHRLTPFLEQYGGHIGYEIAVQDRGKGYAKTALILAINKATEMGITKPTAFCYESNIRSKKTLDRILMTVGGTTLPPVPSENDTVLRYVFNNLQNLSQLNF